MSHQQKYYSATPPIADWQPVTDQGRSVRCIEHHCKKALPRSCIVFPPNTASAETQPAFRGSSSRWVLPAALLSPSKPFFQTRLVSLAMTAGGPGCTDRRAPLYPHRLSPTQQWLKQGRGMQPVVLWILCLTHKVRPNQSEHTISWLKTNGADKLFDTHSEIPPTLAA